MAPDKTEEPSHVLTFAGDQASERKIWQKLKGQFALFYPEKKYNQRNSNHL